MGSRAEIGETSPPAPVLEARGLCKRYGSVLAAQSIDLEIRPGELLALIGDNGAGKSTLINMLNGARRPDEGEIYHRGENITFESPLEARLRGIETVYQDLALAPRLDVAGNLYLGRELVYKLGFLPKNLSILNRRAMRRGAIERLRRLEITVADVSGPLRHLSGGQRQAVAIARAAAWATDVLFMDEPTAALGVKQSHAVLTLARRLAEEGVAVVLITHTLPHVMEFADRVVVLRQGSKVADMPRAEATPEQLVSLIVGFDPGSAINKTADFRT
jgi:ABC-type sugar transport system ATPase subunit